MIDFNHYTPTQIKKAQQTESVEEFLQKLASLEQTYFFDKAERIVLCVNDFPRPHKQYQQWPTEEVEKIKLCIQKAAERFKCLITVRICYAHFLVSSLIPLFPEIDFKNMDTLSFSLNYLTPPFMKQLSQCNFPNLQALDLSYNLIGNKELLIILKAKWPRLEFLQYDGTLTTLNGISSFCRHQSKQLKYLNLSGKKYNKDSMRDLLLSKTKDIKFNNGMLKWYIGTPLQKDHIRNNQKLLFVNETVKIKNVWEKFSVDVDRENLIKIYVSKIRI